MPEAREPTPSFDLWSEPWITLECQDGSRDRQGIGGALLRAHQYAAIYEPSPLVVVGIHRLLTAILQAALDPERPGDLKGLWAQGGFPPGALEAFAQRYGDRFDLFSETAPFLQSADLPLQPSKADKPKTVAYLTPEIPAATEVAHFRHALDADQVYCPACAAGGLVTIPAFATAGGSGIKPSINGVPPLYVVAGGATLFESLAASLLLPAYQPEAASGQNDQAWWDREPVVGRGKEVRKVGYLHSLTFPARRVRLHPEPLLRACTRCGQPAEWGVRTMIFEMGESRPRDAPFWFDPFAAYQLPREDSSALPKAIQPKRGRAAWREYSSLFLQPAPPGGEHVTRRPVVLTQMAELELCGDIVFHPFRCVGVRTRQAKILEWVDAGFDVPVRLLSDAAGGLVVTEAIGFAEDCARATTRTFDEAFAGGGKAKRHRELRARMEDDYWATLAAPFREFVVAVASAPAAGREEALSSWLDKVMREAQGALRRAASQAGDDGASLRRRAQAQRACKLRLDRKRKEHTPYEQS